LKASGPKIRISHLSITIGGKAVLKDINLQIPEHQITVILGPSGCGKTTLLKSLNRLIDLNHQAKAEGEIFIDGQEILHDTRDVTKIRKKMGLLSQRPYPLPMNIYNNIAFGLRISGRKQKRILDRRVEHYLRLAHLWEEVCDRLRDPASALSIGQQQRLCLARGLAVDPDIILADEPTSALDPVSSKIIEDLFREMKKQYTIILVTHVLRQAIRLADHVVFMSEGEVVEQGSPQNLFSNPQTAQLRAYLTEGN